MAELARIPPVTRFLLICASAVTGLCLVQLATPGNVSLDWPRTITKLEVWRPLSTFFYAGSNLPLLFNMFCLYQMSSALESQYLGDSASYAWSILIIGVLVQALNAITLGRGLLFQPLLGALIYLWARENSASSVNILGLISVPARVYPVVWVGIELVVGKLPRMYSAIMGVIVGHLWWFISFYLPSKAPVHLRRANHLGMPQWFRALFDRAVGNRSSRSGITRVDIPQQRQGMTSRTPGHRWGSGHRLGGS